MKEYTHYDYQELVDRATEILSDKPGWGEGYQSSQGQTLIQLLADVTDSLHYMLARRTQESSLMVATLRSSVISKASELGYRIRRVRGHSGFLHLSLVNREGDPAFVQGEIIIPRLTKVEYNERGFYTTEEVRIQAGDRFVDIPVRTGSVQRRTFDYPNGEEVFFDDFSDIDNDVFYVQSGGVAYEDVVGVDDASRSALSFKDAKDAFYDIKYEIKGMRVEFGDGNFGRKPDAEVIINYGEIEILGDPVLTLGNKFQFTGQETLFDFQDPTVEYYYVLDNVTPIVGGSEEESLDDIRQNAALNYKANNRAVSNDDYAYWTKLFGIGDIVDAKAFGEEETDGMVYNANNVFLTYATSTGVPLTLLERQALRARMDRIKTSQAHLVINQANRVMLRLAIDMKKHKNVPISNSHAYRMVYNFIKEYLKVQRGSIGGFFHTSDMIDAMYDITYNNQGNLLPLVDYVKITPEAFLPFDFPPKTGECFARLNPNYVITAGDEFVLNVQNLTCKTTVEAGQTHQDVLLAMRDVIRQITPFDAVVTMNGVALDAHGNPIPIVIDPRVGYHLLIGVDTPYLSETELINPPMIGSAVAAVAATSPAIKIKHYYYSQPAGRRPMIPLRIGTDVEFTAPTDTVVRVFVRENAFVAASETQIGTIQPGELYTFTSTNDQHVLIFDYLSDSSEDVIVDISYPDYVGIDYGIRIKAVDNFGTFVVGNESGDLKDWITLDYTIQLPVPDYSSAEGVVRNLLPGGVKITNEVGLVLMTDDGSGNIIDTAGNMTTGRVNYITGGVTLPETLPAVTPAGKYLLMFNQDIYGNLHVGSSDVIYAVYPPTTIDNNTFSLTTLNVS